MNIKLGEWTLELVDLENEEFKYSNLYDRELHSFDFPIQVKGSSLEKFKKVLEESNAGGVYKLDENNNIIGEYKVCSNGYMYNGNYTDEDTIYNYTLQFEEVVRVTLKSLKIGDLEVMPYEYEEDYNDAIILNAKVKLSKDEMEVFKAIEDGDRYFKVIRNGISNKELTMRFGTNIWSENNDSFKISMVLVEDVYDTKENNSNGLYQPQIQNIMNMLAYHRNLNNELINMLLDKNILTDVEVNELKSKAEKDIYNAHRHFYKVKDIDTF